MSEPASSEVLSRPLAPSMDEMRPVILRWCILLVLGSTLTALVAMPWVSPNVGLALYVIGFGPFLTAYGASLLLLRRGQYGWSAGLLLGGTIVGQIGATLTASGIEAQSLISFVNLIVIAGFTLGGRAALATSALCVGIIGLHLYLDVVGLLPSSRFETSQPGRAVALITTLLTNTGLLFIGLQHYGRSLASERKAVEALVGAYSELAVVQEESVSRAGLAERLVVVGELIVGARERAELLDRVCTELSALPVLRRVWVTDRDGAYAGGARRGRGGPPRCRRRRGLARRERGGGRGAH